MKTNKKYTLIENKKEKKIQVLCGLNTWHILLGATLEPPSIDSYNWVILGFFPPNGMDMYSIIFKNKHKK